jgi:hypothetical protein
VHPEGSETIAEEAVEALDAVEPPSPDPILLLQKMENRLVRHHLAAQLPTNRFERWRNRRLT